uniref:uncharacterized protein LOC109970738 n=1 Tax=Monopterus albus TaxID=43700 RepID=UPI0009B3E09C|nr:uncharacterized protein LOC109970738 [Monopterus albus]
MENQRGQLTHEQDALDHIVACRDKPFLEERFIDYFKGRGVFTNKTIEPSTFVVEYRGNILCHKNTRSQKKCGDRLRGFLFEFSWIGAKWFIDASEEDGTLGRLVNDDHTSPNCEMRKIVYGGKPHLCLFSVKEISPGEEITYNYGNSSYPWRSKGLAASSCEESCSDHEDELPDSSASHINDSHASISSQPDIRDGSHFTKSDSTRETNMFMLPQDDASCTEQEDEAASKSDEHSSDDDYIPSGDIRDPETPSFTRKNYCYVCGKGMSKIARHLLRHADEEPDIAEAFALPKKSKERKKLLNILRNRGNYKHNQEVIKSNSGQLKLRRRPKDVTQGAKTFVHCLHCKGLFKRKELWRHVARCGSKIMSNCAAQEGRKRVLNEIALAESSLSQKFPSGVWKILSAMNQDKIALVVQKDNLLIQLTQYLTEKHVNKQGRNHDYIRQKLREMGRLLLALHERSIFSFEDAIKPTNFCKVAEAVKDLAGFDEKSQIYNKPNLALKLGQSLKRICSIVSAGPDVSEQKVRDMRTFVTLCTKEWSELVTCSAYDLLSGRQVNNPSTIPFTRDVQAFYKCLETTSATAIGTLKKYESPQVYNALCRVTLAQVSVLSKGAPEVSKMTLKSFQERDNTAKVLSKHFIRINIQNRTGHSVAVLLTSELVHAISLLVSKRAACGVHKDNPFLFAKPDSSASSLYHGGNCIRDFSNLCHAKNPEHLRSVHLHKHIARIFQILNLENDELDHLAKLLSLDIRADREYYRSPEAAVELAKIAKLLLAMEKGFLERFKGNSLDEIEIEDKLEPDVEQGNSKHSNDEESDEESNPFFQQSNDVEQQGRQPTPEQDALEHVKARRDKPFLVERFIDPFKGRGVFTHESIEPSSFVVEYRGKIFANKETDKNKCEDRLNNYLFNFSWNGTNWCIDASAEDGSLGRFVNDDHLSPNCEMKKVVCEGKPHLCLFALRKISAGKEITYNYGNSSYPWRATTSSYLHDSSEGPNTSQADGNAAAASPGDETGEDSEGAFSSAESYSDDDYVPDDEPSDDDSVASNDNEGCHNGENSPDFADSSRLEQQSSSDSSIQQEDKADYNSDGEAKDPSSIHRNYCYVCGKAQSKISRHLFTHRKEVPTIAEVFALPMNSRQRKRQLEKLRKKGNYKYNQKVLKTSHGKPKVKRHPKIATIAKTVATCLYCKATFVCKDIWQHMQGCSSKKLSKPATRGRNKILTLVAATVTEDPRQISSGVRTILKNLKKDEIASVVWSDSYILQLAQCLGHGNEKKRKSHEYIKQRLREMGRLLLTLRKKSICSFEDAMKPKNFSKVVEAVRELAGFNEEMKTCDRPSLQLKLGNSLKKIGDIKYARALKEDADKEIIREAETFMRLCADEWSTAKLELNNPSTIAFTQDVQFFYQYMDKTAASAVQSLAMYESPPVYTALLRVTLAQVSVLNKNVVEVSKVTLQSFKERDETEIHKDSADSQSQFEQLLCKRFVKLKLRSTSGKTVDVTLTTELLSAITLLVNKRETCGVLRCNPFLFARPVNIPTSFYQGQTCISIFAARCGAKNQTNLRSLFFRKHVTRISQILSLTNDELDQLAKLLGRDIRTDREYYQTPEAVEDIAKISELLSAMENGSLERFEGKSLEEIEIADKLQPYVEQDDADNSDAEENAEEESSPQLSGFFSSTKKGVPSLRNRGRVRKRQESENEESELNNEQNEVNTENDDQTEEMPVSCAVSTPEETPSNSKEDVTNIWFSDDDDDDEHVNVDFGIDTDEDSVRNEENDGDGVTDSSIPMLTDAKETTNQDKDTSDSKKPEKHTTDANLEETVDVYTKNHVEKKDKAKGEEQSDWMDSSSYAILNTEKNKLSAAVAGMKEVKILIPKLDIEKIQAPVHISQFPSWSVKDQPIQDDNHQCETSSPPTDIKNKRSDEMAIHMTCTHCTKGMMKGQTAYQKKGFTDVFCSKNCLFQKFPINKPTTKNCHYCLKAITQPLDLIMAAVDIKGTMKDFCSPTCLCSFKSNAVSTQTPQSLCSMCKKSCTTTCELTLNDAVHKFCSDSCLEDFCRDMAICEHCSSRCHNKSLKLKLEEDTKTICSENCLKEFKEKFLTPHMCTMCHASQPMSDMIDYKSSEDTVELFCSRTCVTSYKLRPAVIYKLKGKKTPLRLKNRKKGKQSKQKSNTEDVKVSSDSSLSENDASSAAVSGNVPTLIIADSCIVCSNCGTKLPRGQTLYQSKSSPEVFCSASCLSERQPDIQLVPKKCYNCFQVIMRPHNIILAPVDDSGIMKELCSDSCLSSVKSKRNMAAPKPPPQLGPRTECKMCARFCYCKFKLSLNGVLHRLCNDTCFIKYHRDNNLPVNICDICGSVCLDKPLVVQLEDGSKDICSEQCLVKAKEKVKTPQLCPMCQTSHWMSDMVENKNKEGRLTFFCSNRCMMVYGSQSLIVSESSSPSSEEKDFKEVKPSLTNLIKEEPVDEEYNPPPSMSSEGIKDEPNGTKSKHEIIQDGVVHKICSDPCFLRFCTLNKLSLCEKCHSHCNTLLILKMEHGSKKLCSAECLAQLKQKIQTPQPCAMCRTSTRILDMVENHNSENEVELFCTSSCVMASRIQAISASGTPLNCDNCGKTTVPACHLAMSNGSVRNFCTLTCAMAFKDSQKDMTAATNLTGASDHPQCDFTKQPEKLPCAQCRRIIKATPKVIQKEGKMNFVCSLACSQEFKRVNNIMGVCEYCKNERIIRDAKRIDGKDCYFCCDGCKMIFCHELEKTWGKHCSLCAYCHSISKTVVTAKYEGTDEEFCSEDCSSKFKMLFCCVAKCDTCGHKGKLRQSLTMLGEVKYFCDLKCLLHFCNKKVQMVNTDCPPPGFSGTVPSSLVIANVISLASALTRQPSESSLTAKQGSVLEIQPKVVGHLRFSFFLLREDDYVPKVTVLPVPVYVPLPMNMYSQYTPQPLGLPLPLPVPIFLPVMLNNPEPTIKDMTERMQPKASEGELKVSSEMETKQDDKNGTEDRQTEKEVTTEGETQETQAFMDHNSSCNLGKNNLDSSNSGHSSASFPDTSLRSPSSPHTHEKLAPVSDVPSNLQPELPPPASPAPHLRKNPQSSPSPAPAPPLLQETLGKVHKMHKECKLQQLTEAEGTSQRDFSKVMSRKHHKPKSRCGIDAWERWIQWRESQTGLDPVSVELKKDILCCSVAELSNGLCHFIHEVKRPDGARCSPDSLFCLCLSIQQYLFENGRMENIFSDLMYSKFSAEFTKILKQFKPSVSADGYIHSRVQEGFLWGCKQLGAYSPIVLLNTLLFFFCKYFGFTTVEQHRQLSFTRITCCTKTNPNKTKTTVLQFYPPISTDETEPDTDGVPPKKRKKNENKENFLEIMENPKNFLRCPIRLYEFYLSKCPESVRQHGDLFYLHPDQHCVPSSPLWFSSTPLDDSTMEAMLIRTLTVRELHQGVSRGTAQQTTDGPPFVNDDEEDSEE